MDKSNTHTRNINYTALDKTLRRIEKKIASTLKYYIPNTDNKEVRSVTKYLMKDIADIVAENMEENKKIIYRKYTTPTINKIAEAFQNIKIVKQVCYKSQSKPDLMMLIVVYDSKNEYYADNKIYDVVEKLSFSNMRIDLDVVSASLVEEYPDYLKNTVTILKR